MSLNPPSRDNQTVYGKRGSILTVETPALPEDLRLQAKKARVVTPKPNQPNENDSALGVSRAGSSSDVPSSQKNGAKQTFSEAQLDQVYDLQMTADEKKEQKKVIAKKRKALKEKKDLKTKVKQTVLKFVPFINIFINYNFKEFFVYDLLSGLSVGMFIIPQAIAFSLLANVQPQYGFYSAFFAMLIYFIFGTSNHLNMSSQGAVSLIVGSGVTAAMADLYPGLEGICAVANSTTAPPLFNTTTPQAYMDNAWNTASNGTDVPCVDLETARITSAVTLTMIAGAVQIVLGIFQFGFITNYLSDPLNSAFTCGAALHIVSSQVSNMLGVKAKSAGNGIGKFFIIFYNNILVIWDTNWYNLAIFLVSFLILLAIKILNERGKKYIKIPIPIDIIILISSLLLSQFLNWEETLNVGIVGNIPAGFSAPQFPPTRYFTDSTNTIINGLVLGIISYSLSVSVAKTFALRHGYEVDANQELLAYGFVNFFMSFFNTFVSASSIACTSLHESMGGKTLIYSVYAIIITAIGILWVGPVFEYVPTCVLSAIIIVNLKNMILQVEQIPQLYKTNWYDLWIWLVTLFAILVFDLPLGLLIGVIFSLATVIFRSQAPKSYLLGRIPNTDIYKNIYKNKGAKEILSIKIFKFDGSLYFASAEFFRKELFRQVCMNPKKLLTKAKLLAKQEGLAKGDVDIRTSNLDAERVKEELSKIENEGTTRKQSEAFRRVARIGSVDNIDFSEVNKDPEDPIVNVYCIILDMSACAFVDAVGVRVLGQIIEDFKNIGVEIYMAGVVSLVRTNFLKAGFFKKKTEDHLFITVHDAVIAALNCFYSEMLEDESEDSASLDDDDDAFISDEVQAVKAKLSSASSSSSKSDDDDTARKRRRQIRKISRQHSAAPEEKARKLSGWQKAQKSAPSKQEVIVTITETDEDEDSEVHVKNKAQPVAVRALPTFGAEEEIVSPAVLNKRKSLKEEFDRTIAERLKSLPDDEDENSNTNPAFEEDDETDL